MIYWYFINIHYFSYFHVLDNVLFFLVNLVYVALTFSISSQWRHNGHDGVSNNQPHDCLLNSLFMRTSKLRVTGLCEVNWPVTGEFPAQRSSNTEMLPFDDVIMITHIRHLQTYVCIYLYIAYLRIYMFPLLRDKGFQEFNLLSGSDDTLHCNYIAIVGFMWSKYKSNKRSDVISKYHTKLNEIMM